MKKKFKIGFLFISILLAATYCITSFSLTNKKYTSVNEFIADQTIIRIFADDMPGFGNQAASQNVLSRLRSMGFQGRFQFYYLGDAREKIISLFNLPSNIPSIYLDATKNIQFIKINYDSWDDPTPENIQAKENLTLGLAGALDNSPYSCNDYNDGRPKCNYAKIMNVKHFIKLSPFVVAPNTFHPVPGYFDTKLYSPNQTDPVTQKNSKQKYIIMPVPNLNQAKNFIEKDPRGQAFFLQKPALKIFIEGMEKQLFNVLPAYGYPLQESDKENNRCPKCFPGNMLQIICAARYAQLMGTKDFNGPLIIPVFFDYKNESQKLLQFIHSNDWGNHEEAGAEKARESIKFLQLQQVFSIADIADQDAAKRIQQLKSGDILLLSMGPLPQIIFDGIYNHVNKNIWPQIREGANTFNSLILTGKPHFRCVRTPEGYENKINVWEIGFDQVSDPLLKLRLENFYNSSNGFCNGMKTWQFNPTLYQTLGTFILEANNPESPLSIYFKQLKEEALKPENDRIIYALEEVMK